ncbi:hypothetical protein FOG51_03124 [Hanseniaspora uvarum]|nr:hypothetical protein FOG51_03124 [Hanseniaspora uvarum]KAF0275164.1 hypothetical protein FOG50_03892 [Hanseniaspora uvarum]GMM41694.1 hypothetical protein DAHU10_026040 [Hanseniaspora uvarum]
MAIKIDIKKKGKKNGVPAKKDTKNSNNLFNNQNRNKQSDKQTPQKISVSSYTNDDNDNESSKAVSDIQLNAKESILNMIKEVKPTDVDEKLPKSNDKNDDADESMKKSVGLLKMMGYTDEDIYESFA